MSADTPETPAAVNAASEEDANKTVAELDDTLSGDKQDAASAKTADSAAAAAPAKITITFRHVGNAPILKRNKFMLERTRNVHFIVEWLKKFMKLDLLKDQLFLYVNQEFSPSPDVDIGTLYDCFRVGNTVILHYCTTPAWG